MLEVADEKDVYLSQFRRVQSAAEASASWLRPVREAAFAHFSELGFPTTKHEAWKYTNVAPIADTAFRAAERVDGALSPSDIAPFSLSGGDVCRLVFVNGYYAPQLSSLRSLPCGVKLGNLAGAIQGENELVEPHLARRETYQDQAFTALNTALAEDGAFLHVPKGKVVTQPLHLLFVSTADGEPQVAHPRNLIVVDADSQATIVESYVGLGRGVYFTNAVTQIVAGENAVIDHYKIGHEGPEAYHVGSFHLHQDRSSNVSSHVMTLGGALVRNDIHARLDGEGIDCKLYGLYVPTGTQHVDNTLRVEHARPHCNSWEYFKGILDDQASAAFTGRIIVHQDAQKTDAKQTNMSLLLSEDARVDTRPQLEIFADDVKCTHGATIGQVDKEAIFYLRTRGLSEAAARSLLIYAFARESIDEVRVEPLKAQLLEWLFARLPQGELVREHA